MPLPPRPNLGGKVAIVTGASRGIGRECALALARAGCAVVVAAKSATPQPTLPGTIYTVADEIKALGGDALPVVLDLRDENACIACVSKTIETYGRVDVLVNNASALWWHSITETPTKKYDLIQSINARGAFIMTRECLPHMYANGYGRVICMGPPIPTGHDNAYRAYAGKTAYYMSKCGMTMVALGAAAEGEKMAAKAKASEKKNKVMKASENESQHSPTLGVRHSVGVGGAGASSDDDDATTSVTGNALWPATVVESLASENFQLGEKSGWRKATILADCVVHLCAPRGHPAAVNGAQLIDDEYLRDIGATDEDLIEYRCDPAVEPPRLLAPGAEEGGHGAGGDWDVRRGDVRRVGDDKARSKL